MTPKYMDRYSPDAKGFENFAKDTSLNIERHEPQKYNNPTTERAWVAWKSGSKARIRKERREAQEYECELFFGNNIRDAIKNLKTSLNVVNDMTDWVAIDKLRQRVKDVINSCKTFAQLECARRYCKLMSKMYPHTVYWDKTISDKRIELMVGI